MIKKITEKVASISKIINSKVFIAICIGFICAIILINPVKTDFIKNEENGNKKSYGVFIGIDSSEIKKLREYEIVVIDASDFSAKQIAEIKKDGHQVYTYLNIGSVEVFRSYYKEFENITLGEYSTWPNERWIDVSKKNWQDFIINKLAKEFAQKGVDGFFIDNADVYYQYHNPAIYDGIKEILFSLKKNYGCKVIINGGDTFITQVIKENNFKSLNIYGINQESVFSAIDFKNQKFERNSKEEVDYYKKYFEEAKAAGLNIFLLEYVKDDDKLVKIINDYCNENGFFYYVSKNIGLN